MLFIHHLLRSSRESAWTMVRKKSCAIPQISFSAIISYSDCRRIGKKPTTIDVSAVNKENSAPKR